MFTSGKPCLANLISFSDKDSHLIEQGMLAEVILLDFSKAFYIVYQSILFDKMSNIQVEKNRMLWMNNWLMRKAQKVMVTEFTSGDQSTLGFLRAPF